MKKIIMTKKTVEEMESKGFVWGIITLQTHVKNTIAQIECWHNETQYVSFKK